MPRSDRPLTPAAALTAASLCGFDYRPRLTPEDVARVKYDEHPSYPLSRTCPQCRAETQPALNPDGDPDELGPGGMYAPCPACGAAPFAFPPTSTEPPR